MQKLLASYHGCCCCDRSIHQVGDWTGRRPWKKKCCKAAADFLVRPWTFAFSSAYEIETSDWSVVCSWLLYFVVPEPHPVSGHWIHKTKWIEYLPMKHHLPSKNMQLHKLCLYEYTHLQHFQMFYILYLKDTSQLLLGHWMECNPAWFKWQLTHLYFTKNIGHHHYIIFTWLVNQ